MKNNYARIGGVGLLLFTLLSIIHYSIIDLKILVPDDVDIVIQFIRDHEGLFRIGIAMDLMLFTIGMGTFTAIYLILRPFHPFLSLFAFSLILVELAITIGVEITSFQLLELVNSADLNDVAIHDLSMQLDLRSNGYLVVTVLFSIAMVLISWMIRRLSFIHSWIGWLGIIAFSALLISIILNIIIPNDFSTLIVSLASILVMVFQVSLGIAFIRKPGIKEQH